MTINRLYKYWGLMVYPGIWELRIFFDKFVQNLEHYALKTYDTNPSETTPGSINENLPSNKIPCKLCLVTFLSSSLFSKLFEIETIVYQQKV